MLLPLQLLANTSVSFARIGLFTRGRGNVSVAVWCFRAEQQFDLKFTVLITKVELVCEFM